MKNYHSFNLEIIKKAIDAKFVAFETYGNKYTVRVKKNGYDDAEFELNGKPSDITPQRYNEFKEYLIGFYGGRV